MFIFQVETAKPARRYGVEPETPPKNRPMWGVGLEGGATSSGAVNFDPSVSMDYSRTRLNLRLSWTKGDVGNFWASPGISTGSEHGSIGLDAGLDITKTRLDQPALWMKRPGWTSAGVSISSSNGIGLYIDHFGKLSDMKLTVASQGGGAGDTYGMYDFISSLKTGNPVIGTWIAGIKAIIDAGYSIVKRSVEAIWPDIEIGGGKPTAEALAKVRDGSAAQEEKNFDREKRVQLCLQVLQYGKGEPDDRRKAAIILTKLLAEDVRAIESGSNKFNLAELGRAMEIVEKNKEFFASETLGNLRNLLDSVRLDAARNRFGFFENMANRSGFLGGSATGIAALFKLEELSVGKPLDLQWRGWNLPATLYDTGAGWFEDWNLKNTHEAKGFWSAAFGFVEDVVHAGTSTLSKIIGTFSPVYRRNDSWAQDAMVNVSKAIDGNERLFAKFGRGERLEKADLLELNANLIYLNGMLSAMKDGDEKIADRIRGHLWKHEVEYAIFKSKVTRMELDDALVCISGGKYADKITNDALREFIVCKAKELADSYAYLRLVEPKRLSSKLAAELKAETAEIKANIEGLDNDPNFKGLGQLSETIYATVKMIKSGGLDNDWKILSKFIKSGKPLLEMGKDGQKALANIWNVMTYTGDMQGYDGYPTVRQEILNWAGKNRAEIREAIETLATTAAKQIADVQKKGTRSGVEEANETLKLLTGMSTVFKDVTGKFDRNDGLRDTMKDLVNSMDADYDDLKTAADRQKFTSNLLLFSVAHYGLREAGNGIVEKNDLESWAKMVPSAAKTLCDISRKSGRFDPNSPERLMQKDVWRNLNALFGEAMIFSKLSEKERSYVRKAMQ